MFKVGHTLYLSPLNSELALLTSDLCVVRIWPILWPHLHSARLKERKVYGNVLCLCEYIAILDLLALLICEIICVGIGSIFCWERKIWRGYLNHFSSLVGRDIVMIAFSLGDYYRTDIAGMMWFCLLPYLPFFILPVVTLIIKAFDSDLSRCCFRSWCGQNHLNLFKMLPLLCPCHGAI